MSRPALLLVVPLLTGCTGLAGTWRGELTCVGRSESLDGDAVLVLADDRGGEFEGELRVEGRLDGTSGSGDAVLSWLVELEKERPTGRQTVAHLVTDCLLYLDGELIREACPETAQTWQWDGGDELTMGSEDCSLPLVR